MSPEWATTRTGPPRVPFELSPAARATSMHAAIARAATSSAGSNPSGRRCAARYPGHWCSISSGVSPCHGPASLSRSRSSSPTGSTPRCLAMIDAVSEARRRSLDHIAEKPCRRADSNSPTVWAWRLPSPVSGGSARPCQRRTAFHSLWPCRTSNNATDGPGIPSEASGASTLGAVAIVRLFASARQAAGTGRADLPGDTVADVLGAARAQYGEGFASVLDTCRVWVNGEDVDVDTQIGPNDEVAILPPVSGGALPGVATSGGPL